jgi:CheY-like chemotaxis protein
MPAHKVLVIEDNRDTAESMRWLLQHMGYTTQVCHTGIDGLRMAHEWHPDAVLCDIGLPGRNGFEIADELRHDPKTADMLLIAITGYGSRQDYERARESGFDYFYTKPANLDVLFGVLAER